MRQAFAASARVRQKISEVLREKILTNNKLTRSKDAYGVSNWAYLQADGVGYERALTEVISLLSSEASIPETPAAKPRGRPKKIVT